ncbi:co-chaperone GroES [Streptococcus ferus]|uniref:Co-chaperonin GroES n=1 Tax=Streptococcus ferus TaxID=1345 RepID=A0A2X3W1F1_9STRE|nr:co-chaperone GroES [Streptococcus ferus]SQF39447.1 co-chaperonin GroES [Streptococcus ferus]
MLKPLGDRLVIKAIEEKEETAGGFILAGASQDKTKKAQVLAVGEGIRSLNGDLIAPSVTEGETVLVDALAGVPVKEDGQDLLIIREADVLAVVK